jgi:2,3-diphosphopglycerate-independent phosphoglycerate mutase
MSEGKTYPNLVLLRGAGQRINVQTFYEKHGLKAFMVSPTAIIRGVGLTVGMQIRGDQEVPGMTGFYDSNLKGKMEYAAQICDEYDFGFVHIKAVDDAGHDKDLQIKIAQIEKSDQAIGSLFAGLRDKPFDTVVCVTGDHTTPVKYGDHSHEPVPFVVGSMRGKQVCESTFDEIECAKGRLGRFHGDQIIPLLK